MELIPIIVVNGVETRGEKIFTTSVELSAKILEIRRLLREVGFTDEQVGIYFTDVEK